jgi:hypothetical protein
MINLKEVTAPQKALLKRMKNRDWLENNFKEIQEKYADQWVAIMEEKVIAHGNDPGEVKRNIKGDFRSSEMVLVRVPKGEVSQPV